MKQPDFLIVVSGGRVTDVIDLDGKSRTVQVLDMDNDASLEIVHTTDHIPEHIADLHPDLKQGAEYDYRRLCGKLADAFGTDPHVDGEINVIKLDPIWVPMDTDETEHIFAICDDGALLYKFGDGSTGFTHYEDLNTQTINRLTELLESICYE